MTRRTATVRDQRGAIAVMTAIVMSAVLFAIAAIVVDLGNARSRKLTVQKSVDVSAISAGAMLPRTAANQAAILQEVANYLNSASNKVQGQQAATITGTQLNDGRTANGEVFFTTNPRTHLDDTMRIVAPDADVDFVFAGAADGPDDIDVSGEATVRVGTPIPEIENVLPMWVPATCVYGPLAGDVAASPPPSASPSYTLNTPRLSGSASMAMGTISPATAVYATNNVILTLTIDDIPAGKTGMIIRLTFGDTQHVDYRVTWATATTAGASRTVTIDVDDPAADRVPDGATVTNPNENWTVTSTVGTWEVWPIVPDTAAPPALPLPTNLTGIAKFPKEAGSSKGQGFFKVTGGGTVACNEHTRGNFGQIDSPRNDSTQKQTGYARNVAYGLDHDLAAFSTEPTRYECSSDGSPVGALIDNRPVNGRNCLYVDPGNDPQGLTDGMLGGGRIVQGQGRLEKPTNPRCARSDYLPGNGHNYNNDTLSCFLKPGYTLADIAKDTNVPLDALDISIFDSPRFYWVPVVYQGDRMLKKYLAIKTFAPVFLTDETVSSPASATNGLILNPGKKVQSLQIFGFNANALPVKPNADTTDYQNGTRGVVRLVD